MKTILFVISLLFFHSLEAQLSVDWYKFSREIEISNSKKSVYNPVDSCIYTTGMYSGQFEMDGLSVSSVFPKAFFLMKTKRSGEIIWLKTIAENDYVVELISNVVLAVNSSGNLSVGITFNRKLFYGPDSTVLPDDSFTTGGQLFKLDTAGNDLWHKQVFASTIQDVAVNGDNEVFLTGTTTSNAGNVYLTAYSETGDSLWTRTGGSNGGFDEGKILEIDSNNNIYVAGDVEPNMSVYFDTEHPVFVFPYFGAYFLAKYNPSGEIEWLRSFYTSDFPDFVLCKSICIKDDQVFVGGTYEGNLLKLSPTAPGIISPNPGNSTGFLLSYDTSGNLLWKKTPHKSLSGGNGLFMNTPFGNGVIYNTIFNGALVVGNDTLNAGGTDNSILLEYFDNNGERIWYKLLNGPYGETITSMFSFDNSILMNLTTRSPFLQIDNTTMNFELDTARMILVRFDVSTLELPENMENTFSVFPNPTNGKWSIRAVENLSGNTLQVFSVAGELIYEQVMSSGNIYPINEQFPSGIYLVRIAELSEKPIRLVIN